jgi:hypothetical protein
MLESVLWALGCRSLEKEKNMPSSCYKEKTTETLAFASAVPSLCTCHHTQQHVDTSAGKLRYAKKSSLKQ